MNLVIVKSIHHKNTEKIAEVFARVLDVQIKYPEQVDPEELQKYNLIGFGSGIYSGKHHTLLLNLADKYNLHFFALSKSLHNRNSPNQAY